MLRVVHSTVLLYVTATTGSYVTVRGSERQRAKREKMDKYEEWKMLGRNYRMVQSIHLFVPYDALFQVVDQFNYWHRN